MNINYLNPSTISSDLVKITVQNQWLGKPPGAIPSEVFSGELKTTLDNLTPILVSEEKLAIKFKMNKLLGQPNQILNADQASKLKQLRQVYLTPHFNPARVLRYKLCVWLKNISRLADEKKIFYGNLFEKMSCLLNFAFHDLDRYRKTNEGVFSNSIETVKEFIDKNLILVEDQEFKKAWRDLNTWIDFLNQVLHDSKILLPLMLVPNKHYELKIIKYPKLANVFRKQCIESMSELITGMNFNFEIFVKTMKHKIRLIKDSLSRSKLKPALNLYHFSQNLDNFIHKIQDLKWVLFSKSTLEKIYQVPVHPIYSISELSKNKEDLEKIRIEYENFMKVYVELMGQVGKFADFQTTLNLDFLQDCRPPTYIFDAMLREPVHLFQSTLKIHLKVATTQLASQLEIAEVLAGIKKMSSDYAVSAFISPLDAAFHELLIDLEFIKKSCQNILSSEEQQNALFEFQQHLFATWNFIIQWIKGRSHPSKIIANIKTLHKYSKLINNYKNENIVKNINKIIHFYLFKSIDEIFNGENLLKQDFLKKMIHHFSIAQGNIIELNASHRKVFLDLFRFLVTSVKEFPFQKILTDIDQVEKIRAECQELKRQNLDAIKSSNFKFTFFIDIDDEFIREIIKAIYKLDSYRHQIIKQLNVLIFHLQNKQEIKFLQELYAWADTLAKIHQISYDLELYIKEFYSKRPSWIPHNKIEMDQYINSENAWAGQMIQKIQPMQNAWMRSIDKYISLFLNEIPLLNTPLIQFLSIQKLCETNKKVFKKHQKISAVSHFSSFSREMRKINPLDEYESESNSILPLTYNLNSNEQKMFELKEHLDQIEMEDEKRVHFQHYQSCLIELYSLANLDLSLAISMRTKAVLLLEQTLKVLISEYNSALLDERVSIESEGKFIRFTHDLTGLIKLCQHNSIPFPVLSTREEEILFKCQKVVPQESRYPFLSSSQSISYFFQEENSEALKNTLKEEVEIFLNLSLKAWKSFNKKTSAPIEEKPQFIEKLILDYTSFPYLASIEQLNSCLSKIKLSFLSGIKIENLGEADPITKRIKTLWSTLQNIEGALFLLQEMQFNTSQSSQAYSLADATLLNAAVILEQTALLALAYYPVINKEDQNHILEKQIVNGDEKRSWDYSHRIDQFWECLNEYFKDQSLEGIEIPSKLWHEMADYLALANHYPMPTPLSSVCKTLDQIRIWSNLRNGFMTKKTFNWCQQTLGIRSQWEEKIDQHLLHLLNQEIYPQVKIALDISGQLLNKIHA